MTPHVVYVGNFAPPHSTENHYAVSIEALDCRVTRVQERAGDGRRIVREVRTALDDGAALLLYTRTWDTPELGPLLASPPHGVVTAAVHLDVWWGLPRVEQVMSQSMFRAQHVFTADGGVRELWHRLGINHHWLPPGVVDLALVGETLGTPDPDRWPYDVVFVGSTGYHPEWPHRVEMIEQLRGRYGSRFATVGGDGDVRGAEGGAVRGQELNDLYATVPVAVGDSCFAHERARYWSDRFPETWGRGGFLLYPWIEALGRSLGVDYPTWRVGEWHELLDAVDLALDAAPALDAVRDHLGGLVRAEHTYTNRAHRLLNTVGLV